MSKEKYTHIMSISEEAMFHDPEILPMMIERARDNLRGEGWYIYEIEEIPLRELHPFEIDLGIRKFRFKCQRMKPPKIKLDWCEARMIE